MIAIVGGGIAGAALAKILFEKSMDFRWFVDKKLAASHISSGILNPITGRKYLLTENFNILRDAAIDFYGDFITKIPIRRYFKPYAEEIGTKEVSAGKEEWCHRIDHDWIEIHESYQVQVNEFIDFWKEKCIKEGLLIDESFDYLSLNIDSLKYHSLEFDSIIFAEGIGIIHNPFFNTLIPYQPNRGQALKIQIEDFKLDKIIQKGKFICPFQNDFWVGSSFEIVDADSPLTSEDWLTNLSHIIPELIDYKEYKLLDHLGALRVTTKDRKPLIGEHPGLKNIYLFNGLGTKGVSLAPYYGNQLIRRIMEGHKIDHEVDLNRFIR